ncbi:unnamed protein product [Cylicostephanus goldi]|uniref:Uncharacterized protein n=1 Tax=Cylicostephanus goldi TaxID=71465 RepID=A0A3P6RCT4_CYLGO|nr:unnamed protein product [Cylicostephanus goldi]
MHHVHYYVGYNQTVMTTLVTDDIRDDGQRGSALDDEESSSPPPYPGLFFKFGTGLLPEQRDSDNNCNIIKNDMCL